jgi:hypothetical protein
VTGANCPLPAEHGDYAGDIAERYSAGREFRRFGIAHVDPTSEADLTSEGESPTPTAERPVKVGAKDSASRMPEPNVSKLAAGLGIASAGACVATLLSGSWLLAIGFVFATHVFGIVWLTTQNSSSEPSRPVSHT